MNLCRATNEQIHSLVTIPKAAFDSDILVGDPQRGGPPSYDSESWHREMAESGHLYAAVQKGTLVGAAIVFYSEKEERELYVGRIFIAPAFHRQGLGLTLMACL